LVDPFDYPSFTDTFALDEEAMVDDNVRITAAAARPHITKGAFRPC